MQKIFLLLLTILMFASCQQSKPQVFGLYIDGTFEEFMAEINNSEGYRYFPCTMHIDSIVHVSDKHKKIYAYNRSIVDLNENIFVVDTINMDILLKLNKGYIHRFTYTIKMSLSDFQAIRFANERIYGDVDYYDISEYRHVCGWCIGKDYMYLNYILSAQQTEYIYIIN
ncbi:MAG: hypothetical protein J6S09_09290 [Paludibacteraceae bacterium]|nr:hypothetical protein [Paludibacteraceae bacterium]